MFPASTKMGGMCFGFPDVCKTPTPAGPVPLPYPNTAQCPMAQGVSVIVKILNQPVLTKMSQIPLSNGDEAGSAGGVISGVVMGPAAYKQGISKVKVEGNDIVTVTMPTGQNGTNPNVPGAQIAPSQTLVIVIP